MGNVNNVNLYTLTTAKSPKRRKAEGIFVLELETASEPVTLTVKKDLGEVTANEAELKIINLALTHMKKNSRITIYTQSAYAAAGFTQGWIKEWKQNKWKTVKGTEPANMELWKEMLNLLFGHAFQFVVGKTHTYENWMKSELEKMEE